MRTISRDIVGAFIFSENNKILLGKSIKGGVYPDLWVVPGGGINDGENKIDALKREVEEEVGLVINDEQITEIVGCTTGESKKVLRSTGEKVIVRMKFYDYRIDLPDNSQGIDINCKDDFENARWFSAQELFYEELGPATRSRLESLNFLRAVQ
jgi:8-oxo-dGTP diphosphatase